MIGDLQRDGRRTSNPSYMEELQEYLEELRGERLDFEPGSILDPLVLDYPKSKRTHRIR